ncbi:T9SS type A sorting domain-containing protein [Adhaeribacter swui]|uniref:T9SS type A sorting domain-containing protein n=1 Tax=Adhaeribacter swui TaxID=2086471 RepID=A0A7G7GC14_9BACT|nr:cadherin domain-containing protein [Adhaeribacter swui]QNF34698.1 T9SS type A sorting domain-containing protein [Adhaeribacter swui]
MKKTSTALVVLRQRIFLKILLLLCWFWGSAAPVPAAILSKANNHIVTSGSAHYSTWLAASAPVFTPEKYVFSLSEDIFPGTTIGKVKATDAARETLIYTITNGNTNQTFTLDAVSGVLKLGKKLNYHTQSTYQLTVQATNTANQTSETTVTVAVTQATGEALLNKITWSSAANQPYIFYEGQGEVVNNKWYTFSGFDALKGFTPTSRAYVYDPKVNTWSPIAPMPPMNGTKYGGITHAGFTTDQTDIYFAGGYTANASGKGQILGTSEVWKYVVAENRYERLPDLPRVSAAGQLEYLNGQLHYIAGTDRKLQIDLGDHYVLDLGNLAAGWDTLAPLPSPRQHAGSAVYQGKIYFIAGQTGHDEGSVSSKLVHVYDPATDSWTRLADIPAPAGTPGIAHISSSVVVLDNQILVLGGEYAFTKGTRRVSAYTPATNTWTELSGLPMIMRGGVGAIIDGKIYYTGGKGVKATISGVPVSDQSIKQLTWVNTTNNADIKPLTANDTVNLAALATSRLSIRATTSPDTVGSVVFELSGTQTHSQLENKMPYALFGDTRTNKYTAWAPKPGAYTLKVTPYSLAGGKGLAGPTLTVKFTVIDSLVTQLQSTTSRRYAISTLKSGAKVYTDRTYQALTVPEFLQNATFIQVPNDDKSNTSDSVFSFYLNRAATVYVAYDSRGTTLPAWLSNWQKVDSQVDINSPKNKHLVLYRQQFAPGKITMGGNRAAPAAGTLNNYFVIIQSEIVPAAIVTNNQSGLEVISKSPASLNAYPNPNKPGSKVTLELDNLKQNEEIQLTLYDISGQALLNQSAVSDGKGKANAEISLAKITKAGLYLIQVKSGTGNQQIKLLVE